MLELVLESIFEVLDLMLKHIFSRCLKKCLMLQALLKVLVLQALKSVLEPNSGRVIAHPCDFSLCCCLLMWCRPLHSSTAEPLCHLEQLPGNLRVVWFTIRDCNHTRDNNAFSLVLV